MTDGLWWSYIDQYTVFTTQENSNCKMIFIGDNGLHLRWIRCNFPETHINAQGRYTYPKYTDDFINSFKGIEEDMPKKLDCSCNDSAWWTVALIIGIVGVLIGSYFELI